LPSGKWLCRKEKEGSGERKWECLTQRPLIGKKVGGGPVEERKGKSFAYRTTGRGGKNNEERISRKKVFSRGEREKKGGIGGIKFTAPLTTRGRRAMEGR